MINPLFYNSRILFVVDGCPNCDIWEEFIEEINAELKPDKRIEVIDCTSFHELGIVENPIIKKFMPFITGGGSFGNYPVMFFEGRRKDLVSSRAEAEAWLRVNVHEDFLIPRFNPDMFNKECQFGEKGFLKKKVICESF